MGFSPSGQRLLRRMFIFCCERHQWRCPDGLKPMLPPESPSAEREKKKILPLAYCSLPLAPFSATPAAPCARPSLVCAVRRGKWASLTGSRKEQAN